MTRTITNLGVITKVECSINQQKTNVKTGDFYYQLDVHFLNKNPFDLEVALVEIEIFDSLDKNLTQTKTHVTGFSQTLKSSETLADILEVKINSSLGKVKGTYTLKNLSTNEFIEIKIPTMHLEHFSKLN